MRRARQDLGFVALKIEGGILPAEFFQKVAALEAKGQSASDYDVPKGPTLKDEIGRAWRIASAEWREYQESIKRSDVNKKKVGVESWLTTFLKVVLGHSDLEQSERIRIDERSFPITHKSMSGVVPLVLTTQDHSLDTLDSLFGDDGRRRSANGLMQEFLNASKECLWGIASNGISMRLLRDNPSLTRPAYVEANLERIFDEQLYSEFAVLWLIFHGSRFRSHDSRLCWLERWREEAHETGERARADLRKGVAIALTELGNGFLHHRRNDELRRALQNGELTTTGYFTELLRLVYRILFLFTVEDRALLHPREVSDSAKELYSKGYSIGRLRQCALLKRNYNHYDDLWQGLGVTFRGLAVGITVLGLPALDGLFAEDQCAWLDSFLIDNASLLRAVHSLSFFQTADILARVNYRDMDTEELGSVYESLLELHPYIDVERTPWSFAFIGADNGSPVKGSERKVSGSYYTKPSLVTGLINSALVPMIEKRIQENKEDPRGSLLRLKIIDPACGSGHFLLAAARRLAVEIARLDAVGDTLEENLRQHALRDVVRHCIYGVDNNPLAVELCKTALWIETVEPGKPLTFLDSHVRCGDSLAGVLKADVMQYGIPDQAYKVIRGDEEAAARELQKRNKLSDRGVVQGSLFDQTGLERVTAELQDLANMPEDKIEEIVAKKLAWKKAQNDSRQVTEKSKADLFVGAFFARKTKESLSLVPINEDLSRLAHGLAPRAEVMKAIKELAVKYRFFHWYVEFSEIFAGGGFDVVLGNPPWEHTELKEKEWFAVRDPKIASAAGATRKNLIAALKETNPSLHKAYEDEVRNSDGISHFCRNSGRYPLCGRGRINTYAIFGETNWQLVHRQGRVGCILPSGIATDYTTRFFLQDVLKRQSLVSFFDFENTGDLFPSVQGNIKFCLLTLSGDVEKTFVAAGQLDDPDLLADEGRVYVLSAEDIRKINPNTMNLAPFSTARDAKLIGSIYERIPVLLREGEPDVNPWGSSFKQGLFNMTSDSGLFKNYEELLEAGFVLNGNDFEKGREKYLPLYEAKLAGQFTHRAATFEGIPQVDRFKTHAGTNEPTLSNLKDHSYVIIPRHWVSESSVREVLSKVDALEGKEVPRWFLGFRNAISAVADSRSLVGSIVPYAGIGNSMPVLFFNGSARAACCLIGAMNSFVLDYVLRQKASGGNLNFYVFEQLAVPSPDQFDRVPTWSEGQALADWIMPRVLELTYTASDIRTFAEDCGFDGQPFVWDEERRFLIRCELDAALFELYGLKRDDVEYVMESFPIIKKWDEEKHKEYRTKRVILECFDRMAQTPITVGS